MAAAAAAPAMMSESSPSACTSPRISFSHDVQHDQQEAIMHDPPRTGDLTRLDKSLLDEEDDHDDDRPAASAPEFKFCFDVTTSTADPRTGGLDRVSPADELFMNGVLLPIHYRQIIRNKNDPPRPNLADRNSERIRETSTERPEEGDEAKERRLLQEEKEEEVVTTRATLIRESSAAKSSSQNYYSKSFWRFNRSTSLNSSYHETSIDNKKRSSSFWSLHLLSRSNSTGSSSSSSSSPAPIPPIPPAPTKQKAPPPPPPPGNVSPTHHKQALMNSGGSSGPKSLSSSNSNGMHRKPPLMKQQSYHYGSGSCGGGGSNCPPVLNVPPPYIAKGTSDLLGLASFFRINSGVKDKKNKKR